MHPAPAGPGIAWATTRLITTVERGRLWPMRGGTERAHACTTDSHGDNLRRTALMLECDFMRFEEHSRVEDHH